MATARIRLHHLKHNLHQLNALCPNSNVVAVVKADAYGHGSTEIVDYLAEQQDYYAVSRLKEALTLRHHTTAGIVILSETFTPLLLEQCQRYQFDLLVHDIDAVKAIAGQNTGYAPICCWLKVDTGMHRLGISPQEADEAIAVLQSAKACRKVILTSHLASADDADSDSYHQQRRAFEALKAQYDIDASLANSAAMIRSPSNHYQWVRPGMAIYGINPCEAPEQVRIDLKPVMQFCAPVIAKRRIKAGETVGYGDIWQAAHDCTIITIAAGYADGYPRSLKQGARVAINGKRYAVAGRVSMDMITVNVGDDDIDIGTEVELWGDTIPADEVARLAGTISYELFCGISQRVERSYVTA